MTKLEQVRERRARFDVSYRVWVDFVNGHSAQWCLTFDAMEKLQFLLRTARIVSVETPITNRMEYVFTDRVAWFLVDDESATPEDCIVVEADGVEDRS
jgi:hypothetical protein